MKNTMKKLIAFASALSAAVTVPAQSVFGAYNAENVAECEYDELIQMRDKNILIKDGSDSDINDDTQLIVIDENGEKKLIDKSIGINGIYNYVSTTMGRYNYISPTVTPYSFDFMDESYKVSTEQKAVIVGIGDKFAIMNNDNEIVSAEYSNICRINDDYFLTDESEHTIKESWYGFADTSINHKSGLIKADGTVIVEPTDGIKAFYLAGDGKHFLVSSDDGAYIMDTEGNITSESYTYANLNANNPNHYADNMNFINRYSEFDSRFSDSYVLNINGCIVTDENDRQYYLDSNLNIKSKAYDSIESCTVFDRSVQNYVTYGYIGYADEKCDFFDLDGKICIADSDNIKFDEYYDYTTNNNKYTFTSTSGNSVKVYDEKLNLTDEYESKEYTNEYGFGYVNIDDSSSEEINITLYDDHFKNSNGLKITADEGKSIADFTATVSNNYRSPSLLKLEYNMESGSYENDDYVYEHVSKCYWLTENQNFTDISEYSSDYGFNLCDFGLLIGKKADDDEYSYNVNYTILFDNEGNVIVDTNGEATIKINGSYIILQSENSFSITDINGKTIFENVNGDYSTYDSMYIANGKYGICNPENGAITKPVYDNIDCVNSYFRNELPMFYIAAKDGYTVILDEELTEIASYQGLGNAYLSGTPTPYDTYYPICIKNDESSSYVIYDIQNKKITYEDNGLYDSISMFEGDYALTYNYDVTEPGEDDITDEWTGENLSTRATGLIKFDGTEIIPSTVGLNISLVDKNHSWNTSAVREHDVVIKTATQNYIPNASGFKDPTYSYADLNIEINPGDIDFTYAKNNGYTFAVKTEKNTYIVFKDKLFGMADANGNELIKPQFSTISDFRDGVAIACLPGYTEYTARYIYHDEEFYDDNEKEESVGLISVYGDILIEPFNNIPESGIVETRRSDHIDGNAFTCGLWFNEDKIVFMKNDKDGNRIKHIQFTGKDIVNDFARSNGYDIAIKYDNLYYVEKDGLAGVVDSANNVVIPVEYKDILSVVTASSTAFVRAQIVDVLTEEFTPKLRKLEDGSYLANVKDANGKLGIIKITGNEIITGDVDGDGVISAMDASAALTYYVTQPENIEDLGFPFSFEAADWDKNGIIDARDASAILTYYVTNN